MNLAVVRRIVVALGVFGVSFGHALGQEKGLMQIYGESEGERLSTAANRVADESLKQAEQRYATAMYAPLEGAVDPDTYIVGPNDQFTISFGGMEPVVSAVLVAADGGLVIPGLGRVEAGGRTLAEVDHDARELLNSSFKNVEVGFALTRPREFWVHVTGAVPQPGRYLSRPVGRLEDILKEAFLLGRETPDIDPTFRPALRNILITHQDGSSDRFDLVKYYRTGDVASNPYLRDGDAISIPSYDRVRSSVFVSGDIPFAGAYDYRRGDTILDLVALGAGSLELDSGRVVRLTRRAGSDSVMTWDFTLGALTEGTAESPTIKPLDHVNIPKTDVTMGVAAADGWLSYPGQYPIEVGVTTLTDLIDMAGGFREEALIRGAYLERNSAFGEKVTYTDPSLPVSTRYEIISDTSATLWQMRLGNLDFLSRQFLARWIKMDRRVSVDVLAATRPGADPVYLHDGDRLVVPRDERSVFVIGEVTRPGRVPLMENADANRYVTVAGGRGPFASDTYVIHAGTGALQPPSVPVYSGDYIFVNRDDGEVSSYESERLRIMDDDQQVRNRQLWLQAVTAGAAVVTTTILVIREIGN